MVQLTLDIDVPPAAYEALASRSCREVLLSNLEDFIYLDNFSGLTSSAAVELCLKQVNDKVTRLLQLAASLGLARNAFISISRLPAEILLQIFRLCSPKYGVKLSHPLAFAQVCAAWRKMALSTASLWTEIDYSQPAVAKFMLARSQSTPVSIYLRNVGSIDRRLLLERERVKGLSSFISHSTEAELNDYLSGHFPVLETLDLTAHYCGGLMSPALDAPLLQRLALQDCAIRDWGANVVGNLTHLTLEYGRIVCSFGSVLTPSGILKMLTLSPKLVSLTLRRLVDMRTAPDLREVGPPQEIKLGHLKRLKLQEDILVVLLLLAHMHLPTCEDMDIGCSTELADMALIPALRRVLHTARWQPFDDARMWFSADYFECVCLAPRRALESEIDSGTNKNKFTLKLFDPRDSGVTPNDLETFLKSFVANFLLEARALGIINSLDRYPRMDGLSVAISTLSSLRLLEIKVDAIDIAEGALPLRPLLDFLFALVPGLEHNPLAYGMPTGPDGPFPALQILTLRNFKMTHVLHDQTVYQHLVALKGRRRKEGRPVDVILEDCITE